MACCAAFEASWRCDGGRRELRQQGLKWHDPRLIPPRATLSAQASEGRHSLVVTLHDPQDRKHREEQAFF